MDKDIATCTPLPEDELAICEKCDQEAMYACRLIVNTSDKQVTLLLLCGSHAKEVDAGLGHKEGESE